MQSKHKISIGLYYSHHIKDNPKALLFTISRYKFASRLLGEKNNLSTLELGCNEGLGTNFLSKFSKRVVGIDFDKEAIKSANDNFSQKNVKFIHSNFLNNKYGVFDCVVSIDVIEHINKKNTPRYLNAIYKNLKKDGFCIIGTPNMTAQKYASKESRIGHINLYTAERLRDALSKLFSRVFIFGMNDEVVHTGFYPMSHYIFALGVYKRERRKE